MLVRFVGDRGETFKGNSSSADADADADADAFASSAEHRQHSTARAVVKGGGSQRCLKAAHADA